jgi:hypothetical protein
VTVGGHLVYGLSVQAGVGYRNDVTNGVPTGGQPQGAYMVTSGTHVNDLCCFDFGNAETSNTDTGNGHMDAINFGTECWFTPCTGAAPGFRPTWRTACSWAATAQHRQRRQREQVRHRDDEQQRQTDYTIADGNAQSGGLHVEYSGPLPDIGGYTPMHQEGSILLGTGGDDSNGSDGSFFEGVVTAGYPSDRDRQRRPGQHRRGRLPAGGTVLPRDGHRLHDHQRQQRTAGTAGRCRPRPLCGRHRLYPKAIGRVRSVSRAWLEYGGEAVADRLLQLGVGAGAAVPVRPPADELGGVPEPGPSMWS